VDRAGVSRDLARALEGANVTFHRRLDLTAPTRHMGPRKLLKQGIVLKARSGRRLRAYLCSDILVLTDEGGRSLYRMPIPLAHAQVKESSGGLLEGEHSFYVHQPYPRGGDSIALRAVSAKEYKGREGFVNTHACRC